MRVELTGFSGQQQACALTAEGDLQCWGALVPTCDVPLAAMFLDTYAVCAIEGGSTRPGGLWCVGLQSRKRDLSLPTTHTPHPYTSTSPDNPRSYRSAANRTP